jgi:hypothetical protein
MDEFEYQEQLNWDDMEDVLLAMGEDNEFIIKEIVEDDNVIGVISDKDKIVKFPITSNEKYLKDKKCNYKILGLLTLLSKHTKGENHRYIYHKDVMLNKDMLETLSGNKMDAIIKTIKKLIKLEGDLIIAKTTENGIIYQINFLDKNGRKYVLIEEKILKKIMTFTNNNVLKVYILLKYRCGYDGRIITRDDICTNIGLSPKSHKNLQVITQMLTGLEQVGLIEINNIYDKILKDGKEQMRKLLKISIVKYEDWEKFESKSKDKIKGSWNFIDYNF